MILNFLKKTYKTPKKKARVKIEEVFSLISAIKTTIVICYGIKLKVTA